MNIEDLKIIAGSPEEVQAQAQAYLTEHPNAQILGTAITMKRGPVIEPAPLETKADTKAKDKEKPAVNTATGATPPVVPEPIAVALNSIEYGPDEPVVSLTLGKVF